MNNTYENTIIFLKDYHRLILWITLGVLFFFDVLTTAIGLQKGGFEQTLFMIPYVENPFHHLLLKILAFCIICIPIELFLKWLIKKSAKEEGTIEKYFYAISYWMIILALIYVIWLFFIINANNIAFIISRSTI